MVENGENAAVVSSELARKLYMTEDIIGNRLVLGDKKYKIVGVYDADTGYCPILPMTDMKKYTYHIRLLRRTEILII